MIRKYRKSDWNTLLDIYNRAKPDELKGVVEAKDIVPLDKDDRLLSSFRNSAIYVLENENKIVGYAGKEKHLISFLFVDPGHYRKGYGSLLLEYMLKKMDERAWLVVAQNNTPAINLYTNFGFKIAYSYSRKYNGKTTIDIFRLALKPELGSWKSEL